jgi:hypothetical protein
MSMFNETTVLQASTFDNVFKLDILPTEIVFKQYGESKEVPMPDVGESVSVFGVKVLRIRPMSVKFVNIAPGVLCMFRNENQCVPVTFAGRGYSNAIFKHSKQNAILDLDVFGYASTHSKIAYWELENIYYAPSMVPTWTGSYDVRVTPGGILSLIVYERETTVELKVVLEDGNAIFVCLDFVCVDQPCDRLKFKFESIVQDDGERCIEGELVGLDQTPEIHGEIPEYASLVVTPCAGDILASINFSLNLAARSEDPKSWPFVYASFPGSDPANPCIYSALDLGVSFKLADRTLKVLTPAREYCVDLHEAAGMPAGIRVNTVKVDGNVRAMNEEIDGRFAVLPNGTLFADSECPR